MGKSEDSQDAPPLFDLFLITADMPIIPNLNGLNVKVNNIMCIEKYIAVKTTKHKFTIKNGLLQMRMLTLLRKLAYKKSKIKHLYCFSCEG